MNSPDVPLTQDLVLVGGGHAHALVLRKWGMNPLPGARLTVINPGPTAPYTGMLPGHVAGHYSRDTLEIDLVRLCRFAGARLILAHATDIDRTARLITVEGQGPIAYDVASIDIGITAEMSIAGFADHAVGAKPLDIYAQRWRDFVSATTQGTATPTVAVIGGGVAGCELALAMSHALQQAGVKPAVTVIEAGPQISGVGDTARRKLLSAMSQAGIALRTDARVTQVTASQVLLDRQEPVQAALTVGAAGAFPHGWLARTDLPLIDGFIETTPDLSIKGDTSVFAVGDCAAMPFAPRPKAGVFAVRAAPVLHHNLRAALTGGARKIFKPQKNYLKLISFGGKSAMAEKFGFAVSGPLLWRWKDRIDRAFMDKLDHLPPMKAARIPETSALGAREIMQEKPLCGGCGAKVGAALLADALSNLDTRAHPQVVTGVGDDAAVVKMPGGGFQVLSTDHLRAMVHDPVQMTRIAAVHALGDVWAMGAAPQVALSSLILPRMSPPLQARTLREITDAARAVFDAAGASLVGGHTTMGAELTIGFTVTGTRDTMPITIAGAQPDDVLLLTRPIGSGVMMAAHMEGTAQGRDVANTLAIMQQPQSQQADILRDAHAMTDVTGFGLAGHVLAMCKASGLCATLRHADIPVYAGARALSDAGVGSSLLQANRDNAPTAGIDDPLIHDPQTAGGLLAALPPKAAETALRQLESKGLQGWIIGTLQTGAPSLTLR
ncbi:selenide, water dikinase SelD [uncultured Sulfitobacter sp.]|jgi:selenide,water dikinase|uniref:selenide, water dikinase SelD n=1 Tax=Sulfitobacter sp. SH22 TaxID=3421172 RepID=UPI0025FE3598|nr:selenide, water dikinase SelD [uncultured Sulfitobacter sp.]